MSQRINEQSEFYNEWFSNFRYANQLQLERANCILQALHSLGLVEPKIIDLGCGAGWLCNILGTFGPTLGVDLSDHAIEVARHRYPVASFEAVDIFSWDHPREAFDVVVSQEVIEHVEDQSRYIEIAHSLLRPGGYLILTTPNGRTMMAMPADSRKLWTNQPIENWLTLEELRELLSRKFTPVRSSTIVMGMGSTGSYRLMNSERVRKMMLRMKWNEPFKRIHQKLGYGLHLVAVARKTES